ncbi:ComEC/Rec2 family protein [Wolbachia endosymbiont of Armadillidium vulgare str. wVulC]|uniref:ComEC/Rec2 family competence protein n=1 Tax=Wolbachia endosymbiont of Armadillidium vulgare TaxID=77039 RepID=UPI000649FE68|nr:ComEC/Rec2 family competence protein [Wolbachia endosymbiont of Armadillidium vulgare]KLT21603.1 ComEC/Rec2 family protein [Wolbachia endosymbiont of Armadillidium vulgare str. wVulC]
MYLLTFFNIIVNYIRNNLRNEKYNLILWVPVFQCVGALTYFSLNCEPSCISIFLLLSPILILIAILHKKYAILCIALIAVLVGFTASKLRTASIDTKILDKEKYVKDIVATVKDINDRGSYKQFLLSVSTISKSSPVIPAPPFVIPVLDTGIQKKKIWSRAGMTPDRALDNIRISVRTKVEEGIKIGDQVKLSAKLFPLKIAPSEYAYDFARIAYYQKISATGFATSKIVLHKKAEARKFQEYIESFRQYIYENLQQNTKKPHADIISALLIGKKDGIDQKTMNAIRDSGIAHLFAISGLHLSFVAGLFFIVFRNLFAISETLTLKYNTKKISAFLTILPTTFYLLITGMQISAQRAYIMVILVLVAIMIERKYRGLIAIAFAASVILIIEPEAILKPGFQMSFSAVLALVASYQINANKFLKIKIIKYFVSIMISSVIASLATVPYTIYNFNYFSISGIITNLIAIPIVTLIIIPLGIIYVLLIPLGIEWIITPLIERPIESVLYITNAIANLQYLIIPIRTFPASSIIIITFGLLWLCLWERNWRFLGIFFIVLGICFSTAYKTPDILINADNVAVKESDNLLYSLTRKNRNFVVKTWAKQNGQNQILNHTKYSNPDKRLKCNDYGCIYNKGNSKSVLLAYKKEDILENCGKVDLIIQLSEFNYSVCNTKTIKYADLGTYGTHSAWLTNRYVKINTVRSNRPWHMLKN